MKKLNFIITVLLSSWIFYMNYSIAKLDKLDELAESQANLEIVKLKPSIKVVDNLNGSDNLELSKLDIYLRKLIIIDIPNFKNIKKYRNESLQPVNPFKDLNISSGDYSYVMSGSNGEKIFGKGVNFLAKGLEKDDHYDYTLIRPDFSYYHPLTGEYLGTGMLKIGTAKIVERGKISILEVNNFNEPIKAGTLIIPGKSLNLTNNIKLVKNLNNLQGYILSIIPNKKIAFKKDILLISLGSREGVKVGNLFKVNANNIIVQDPYQSNQQYVVPNDIPKGEILIYEVFDKLSLGIVIKSTTELKFLDTVYSN